MKFLAVFAALVAVAASHSTWTLPQLSEAIQNPNTDPGLLPFLEHALNELMEAMFAGESVDAVTVTIPAVDLSTWTLAQLSDALEDPTTDAALVPYLEQALNALMDALISETPVEVSPVAIPAMDVTSWSLYELSEALQDPATNPALVPYLEHALNEMMSAIMAGQEMDVITVVIPAGLTPVAEVAPVVVPSPAETPVGPAAPASPLVQIIVNINQQQAVPVAPVIVPESVAEIAPEPVIVVDHAPIDPEPVIVVDQAPTLPESVIIAPIIAVPGDDVDQSPVIVPEPVVVSPIEVVEQAPIVPLPVVAVPIIPDPVLVVEA